MIYLLFKEGVEIFQENSLFPEEFVQDKSAFDVVTELGEMGIDVLSISDNVVRAVVHLHITDEDISRTIEGFKAVND